MTDQVIVAVIGAIALVVAALVRPRPRIALGFAVLGVVVFLVAGSAKTYRVDLYNPDESIGLRSIVSTKAYCRLATKSITGAQPADCGVVSVQNGWQLAIGESGGRGDARGYCEMSCWL